MPIYEYRCRNGHTFEVMQSMSEDALTSCNQCEASVERVFHPVAVVFKGSGFYSTDYARKGSAKPSSDSGSDSKAKSESAASGDSSKGKGGESGGAAPAKAASSSD